MKKTLLAFVLSIFALAGFSQEKHFRSTRIINLHSIESLRAGDLEFKISHRFGAFSSGKNQFWGLDDAQIRLALEYGLTENLMFGIGRSSQGKIVDGFLKYNFFDQKAEGIPFSLSYLATTTVNTFPALPDRELILQQRLAYVHQLILSSKIHDRMAIQLSPTIIHKNLVVAKEDENTNFVLGIAGKYDLTKVMSINAEYIPRFTGMGTPSYEANFNSLSVGMGVNTRGHFFELHLTNSFGMVEQAYALETSGDWTKGDIHLGFNIVRDFKIHRPKKK